MFGRPDTRPHLVLATITLREATEYVIQPEGWDFVRVVNGVGYLLLRSGPKELCEGDVVIVRGIEAVTFRASQLGNLVLTGFQVDLRQLHGVLSSVEIRRLDALAAERKLGSRCVPADHELAQLFAELCDSVGAAASIGLRCRMVELFGLAAAEDLAVNATPVQPSTSARERFTKLCEQVPESELLAGDVVSLARKCGCSERHFTRLFRDYFGRSIRSKQIDLRLIRAQQLLRESDTKIIDVALECGYRHLGLFNAVFKQRFGMTPSQFRTRHRQKQGRRTRPGATSVVAGFACCLLSGVLSSWNLAAAEAANSGAASPRFEVRAYEVQGNTLLTQDMVDAIFKDYTGTAVGIERIREGLAELQLAYRGRGFVTVAVSLPQQQLTNGVVKVQVTEGRLAEILVTGQNHYSSNNVMRALPGLSTNLLLNSLVFQQELDRANANRDRQIYPQIGPGPEPGTSSLTLKVKDRLPLHGRVELNNQSTPSTPDLRLNTAVQYNNLWQHDHQVGAQYSFSPESYKDHKFLPFRFFDQPLIASYSAFYRAPLGTGGEARDYSVGEFGFDEVTRRFKAPPLAGRSELIVYASRSDIDSAVTKVTNLSTNTGTSIFTDETFQQNLTANVNLGFRYMRPLPPVLGASSSVSLGLDFKQYSLRHFETNVISDVPIPPPPPGQAPPPTIIRNAVPTDQPVRNRINYMPFNLGWDALWAGKSGNTTFSLNNSFYPGGILDGSREFGAAAYTSDASAAYDVIGLSFSREQRFLEDWSIRLKADGQWATGPLISNEQFGIGGSAGVRGYRDGQDYGDTGWRTSLELHPPVLDIGLVDGSMPMFIRSQVFVDYAQRYLLHSGAGRESSEAFWGAGFGLSTQIGERVDLRAYLGWTLKEAARVKPYHMHLGFTLAAQF